VAENHKQKLLDVAYPIAALLIPVVVFLMFLWAPLPAKFLYRLLPLRLPHLIFGLLFFTVCFRLPAKVGWLAGASLSSALFALLLGRNWALGISNANIIGGFIPYKDGFYYYNGAGVLLSGQQIPASGLQGAFRPLFPALLAVLLSATGHNLMAATAIITLVLTLSCFCAAWTVRDQWGSLPAALLMVLMTAFIAPLVGFNLTELPGLAYVCLSFALLVAGDARQNPADLLLGGLALILANSIRAGAFFMLPLLALYAARRLHTGKGVSVKYLAIFSAFLAAGLVATNWAFPHLLTAPGTMTNGSFAWMLYGQAVGGAGWQYHFQALGTSDPAVVLHAAVQKILTYPQGLMIGTLKAYRDLFTIDQEGIFDLFSFRWQAGNLLFWIICVGLTITGLYAATRKRQEPPNLLMLFSAIGIWLSIPFLPPVDGGKRFYAAAVPFIYGLAALGVSFLTSFKKFAPCEPRRQPLCILSGVRIATVTLLAVNLIAPVGLLAMRQPADETTESCPAGRIAYTVAMQHGSFLDILPDGHPDCGHAPQLCLSQFDKYGQEKHVDDFFREVLEQARSSGAGVRLAAVHDLNTMEYYFFILPLDLIPLTEDESGLSGCAIPIRTQFQNIRLAQSARPIRTP